MTRKKIIEPEKVIRLYQKGFSLSSIQNIIGCPTGEASRIVKEAGLFNPNRQRDFFNEQDKNKRVN